jgi:hypothetical protein
MLRASPQQEAFGEDMFGYGQVLCVWIDAVIDHGEAVAHQLGRADMLLPTRGQRRCAPDRDQFLRQLDAAVIRAGSVVIFMRFACAGSFASHRTIAKLVGAAGAARSAVQNLW